LSDNPSISRRRVYRGKKKQIHTHSLSLTHTSKRSLLLNLNTILLLPPLFYHAKDAKNTNQGKENAKNASYKDENSNPPYLVQLTKPRRQQMKKPSSGRGTKTSSTTKAASSATTSKKGTRQKQKQKNRMKSQNQRRKAEKRGEEERKRTRTETQRRQKKKKKKKLRQRGATQKEETKQAK
jgi:hypothetical protein